jgi:hypothetical protein
MLDERVYMNMKYRKETIKQKSLFPWFPSTQAPPYFCAYQNLQACNSKYKDLWQNEALNVTPNF